MTYEFLKKNGTLITEIDFNNNGVYAGTKYYYLHNNTLYCRYEPTNAFQYNGKVDTYEVIDNVKEEFKKYNEDYFIFEIGLDEEGYIKLKEIYKAEFDKEQQYRKDEYDKSEKKHKEAIPNLCKEWMNKGREVLTEDKWEFWDKIVPIRLNDLYHGMELGCCLNIVKILNNNGTLEDAKNEIEKQNHSGMSYGLVCSMVKEFCNRGQEFIEYVK